MVQNDGAAGSVATLLNDLLDSGYDSTAGRVVDAIAGDMNSGLIQVRLEQLDAEAQRLAEAGQTMDASNPVFRALLADLETVLGSGTQQMNNVAGATISTGINAAGTFTQTMSGLTIVWNQPDPEAINQMVGFVDSPEFAAMISGYEQDVIDTVANQAIRGSIMGWSPTRIANEIRHIVEGFPSSLANTLMRTLQLQSYRTSSAIYQNANVDVITKVYRAAALDSRCCLACIALSGTVIWDSRYDAGRPIPRVHDHHNGRCTSIVDTGVRQVNLQNGVQWFQSLTPQQQLELAGYANLNAMNSGSVSLLDFVRPTYDPVFGEMITESSLVGVLGAGASEFYSGR